MYPKLHKTILGQYSGIPSEASSSPFSASPSPPSSFAAPLVSVSSAPPSRTSTRSVFASVAPLSTPPPRPLRTPRTTASTTPLVTPRSPTRLAPRNPIGTSSAPSGSTATPDRPSFLGPNKPRALLVTGSSPKPCENLVGDHYLLKSIKNKIDYILSRPWHQDLLQHGAPR
ncbi:xyloglucan 6-xylosyltransferase 2 [Canna indica]|uniref:Xyloglucan 6-xylosyltransferase 2 n=1 Tax=Canna indica TaxID=4628 RepID=A0AAQ3L3I5_9LILI|nr:xyloglucan 6-xylosyltransferase 2 [Canna indica]